MPLLSGNAYIPANVVKKFYDKMLEQNYTPEQLATMGKRLFHEGLIWLQKANIHTYSKW
ncbi:MAG: hypothetical protein IJ019_03065 [Alphaproteobacteria bacterium]|nr:hypothetical protein [Alphaproteobacteria bacterium]